MAYEKRLTLSLPAQWEDSFAKLRQEAGPGCSQAELLRRLIQAGLEASVADRTAEQSVHERELPPF